VRGKSREIKIVLLEIEIGIEKGGKIRVEMKMKSKIVINHSCCSDKLNGSLIGFSRILIISSNGLSKLIHGLSNSNEVGAMHVMQCNIVGGKLIGFINPLHSMRIACCGSFERQQRREKIAFNTALNAQVRLPKEARLRCLGGKFNL